MTRIGVILFLWTALSYPTLSRMSTPPSPSSPGDTAKAARAPSARQFGRKAHNSRKFFNNRNPTSVSTDSG